MEFIYSKTTLRYTGSPENLSTCYKQSIYIIYIYIYIYSQFGRAGSEGIRRICSIEFINFMNLTNPIITKDKSYVLELESRVSKIKDTYTSRALRDLYSSVECVFNKVWNSIFLVFIQKTYNIPIISLDTPTTKNCDHHKKEYVIEVCMLFVMTCPCNIMLTLQSQPKIN